MWAERVQAKVCPTGVGGNRERHVGHQRASKYMEGEQGAKDDVQSKAQEDGNREPCAQTEEDSLERTQGRIPEDRLHQQRARQSNKEHERRDPLQWKR